MKPKLLAFLEDLVSQERMIKFNENNMPSFFIPIVGMKKKLFDDIPANLSESYDTILLTTESDLERKYNLLHDSDGYSSQKYRDYMNILYNDDFESYINNQTYKDISEVRHAIKWMKKFKNLS